MNRGLVLTVEDEPLMRQGVQAYLEDSGFQVCTATNGIEGWQVFQNEQPDVVLSDLRMPGMTGIDLLSKIREFSKDVPVVVISGAGSMDDVVDALRLGASDYLIKPICDMEVLEHVVSRCMQESKLKKENQDFRIQLEEKNAELQKSLDILKEDHEAAKSVQQKLFPPAEFKIGAYSICFRIYPSLFLSGDFVDYFCIDSRFLIFYIADVSGHGTASAFVTVLVKNTVLKIYERYSEDKNLTILDPAKMLSLLNKELYQAGLGKYLTMIYGVVDMKENTLFHASGGHLPLPVLSSGKKSYFLEGEGGIVGIQEKGMFKNHFLKLPVKFTLSLFSDGILELLTQGQVLVGESKLLSIIENTSIPCSIEHLMDQFNLKKVNESVLVDDIGCLLLQRIP